MYDIILMYFELLIDQDKGQKVLLYENFLLQ